MFKKERRIYLIAAIAGLIGFVLLSLSEVVSPGNSDEPNYHELKLLATLLKDFGIAFIIAGVLATSFELAFHKRQMEDAFEATLGYLLPKQLKPELIWIYGQQLLCTDGPSPKNWSSARVSLQG